MKPICLATPVIIYNPRPSIFFLLHFYSITISQISQQ
nr:MAG TPA: hypothetical protein [Caudoviricetes sp.]